jgi:hypothetical protein
MYSVKKCDCSSRIATGYHEADRGEDGMKRIGITLLVFASLCRAQEAGEFQPAATNVLDAP